MPPPIQCFERTEIPCSYFDRTQEIVCFGKTCASAQSEVYDEWSTEGTTPGANAVIDVIDVVTALLLILGQINNTGPWISSGRFSFVVSGPAFGNANIPVAAHPSETSKQAPALFAALGREIST